MKKIFESMAWLCWTVVWIVGLLAIAGIFLGVIYGFYLFIIWAFSFDFMIDAICIGLIIVVIFFSIEAIVHSYKEHKK